MFYYSNGDGQQMPFDNSVLLAIHRDFRRGLKFTDQTGTTIDIGESNDWLAIPGTENEGLLYDVPTGGAAPSQPLLKHFKFEIE